MYFYGIRHPFTRDVARCPDPCLLLDTPSGESEFTARGCQTLESTCDTTRHPFVRANLLICSPRVPLSSRNPTYVFVPRDFLRGLFGVYGMDLPHRFAEEDFTGLGVDNDTIPSNVDPSTISYVGEFLFAPLAFFTPNLCSTVGSSDNGRAVSLYSTKSHLDLDYEWSTVETVLIRFDTRSTTNGTFPVHAENTAGWEIGYDAAVCVQKYEPWIVEAYNATFASPSILRLVEKGNGSTSSPSGKIRGTPIASTRYLNASNKKFTFDAAHGNGIRQMMKVNYGYYAPSPIVGPDASQRTRFLLTSTYSTGRFFHRRR